MEVFGQRSSRAVLTLVDRIPEFEQLSEAIKNGGGAAAKTAAEMEKGLNKALKGLSSAIESVKMEAFEKRASMVEGQVRDMSKSIRDNSKEIARIVDIFSAMLIGIGTIAATVLNTFFKLGQAPFAFAKWLLLSDEAQRVYDKEIAKHGDQIKALKTVVALERQRLETVKQIERAKDRDSLITYGGATKGTVLAPGQLEREFEAAKLGKGDAVTMLGIDKFEGKLKKLKATLQAVGMDDLAARFTWSRLSMLSLQTR